jgi:PHP domain
MTGSLRVHHFVQEQLTKKGLIMRNINMHIHSHFSFNAVNWSPARIAEECASAGLDAAGLIDFDVLDGVDEFFNAGERVGLRTVVGVETRVFYPEYDAVEIDSPGEPGVHYMDGIGFTALPAAGSRQAAGLQRWRDNAQQRNAELIERINPHVPALALDYAEDVVPLSPGGCPTERHIITAYIERADIVFSGEKLIDFWSETLQKPRAEVGTLLANRPAMADVVRSRLAKRGGFGYIQPTPESFPSMEDFIAWVTSCGAIPMESWLDGTSPGENDAEKLLDTSIAKGCRALNIIPDRNWNIKCPDSKALKVSNLRKIIALADARDLPINIGTEMNKANLPFVDDLTGPILKEFAETFHRGAMILVGHTLCGRFANFGYLGENALQSFPDVKARNHFFAAVGSLPPVTTKIADALRSAGPERAFAMINDAVTTEYWKGIK